MAATATPDIRNGAKPSLRMSPPQSPSMKSASSASSSSASASASSSPRVTRYRNMFQKGNKVTPQLDALLRAIGQYVIDEIGNKNVKQLTPDKMADFYEEVGGDYDSFFREQQHRTISYIYKHSGCQHSLQPTENDLEFPSIPALTLRGFVRWESMGILLDPSEHVPLIQYAVRNWNLRNLETGESFPPNLPRDVFPARTDPEFDRWYQTCVKTLEEDMNRPSRSPSDERDKEKTGSDDRTNARGSPDSADANKPFSRGAAAAAAATAAAAGAARYAQSKRHFPPSSPKMSARPAASGARAATADTPLETTRRRVGRAPTRDGSFTDERPKARRSNSEYAPHSSRMPWDHTDGELADQPRRPRPRSRYENTSLDDEISSIPRSKPRPHSPSSDEFRRSAPPLSPLLQVPINTRHGEGRLRGLHKHVASILSKLNGHGGSSSGGSSYGGSNGGSNVSRRFSYRDRDRERDRERDRDREHPRLYSHIPEDLERERGRGSRGRKDRNGMDLDDDVDFDGIRKKLFNDNVDFYDDNVAGRRASYPRGDVPPLRRSSSHADADRRRRPDRDDWRGRSFETGLKKPIIIGVGGRKYPADSEW